MVFFRPLGETEKLIHVDVRIIAATTENPNSHLLKNFHSQDTYDNNLASYKG